MALHRDILSMFTGRMAADAARGEPSRPPEDRQVFDVKEAALRNARTLAEEMGREPTLTDYYAAAQQLVHDRNLSPELWTPQMIADLGGHKITGFRISEPTTTTGADGKPTHVMQDLYDQDGNGHIDAKALSKFYDNIRLAGCELKDCYVEPATSFNNQISQAKSIDGVTFNNMQAGDTFTFGQGAYHNIKLTNIRDGEIIFNGSKVDGLDMEGATVAAITLGQHTSVEHMNARGAHIVKINAERGAEITRSNFDDATIDMGSNLEGLKISRTTFNRTNFHDVDLRGVRLANVEFNGTSGLNLEGAMIGENVKVNGVAVQSAEQFKSFENSLAALSSGQLRAMGNLGMGESPSSPLFAGLVGGMNLGMGGVDVDAATLSTAVASQPRTVSAGDVASVGNMAALQERVG